MGGYFVVRSLSVRSKGEGGGVPFDNVIVEVSLLTVSLPFPQSDWDDLDLGVTPKGSRKMLVNMDDTDSLGRVNEMYEDDDFENRDLDDLVFALKTGGQFEREPTYDDEKPELDGSGQGQEHYEMRRISIADTHL